MRRVCDSMLALLLAACGSSEPDFPDRVHAGDPVCGRCGPIRGQECGFGFEWGCGPKSSCVEVVPCDPECCPAREKEKSPLDLPPWGPVLAAVAADQRAPTGMIAYHHRDQLFLLRPDQPRTSPSLLRLPKPVDSWRWSAAQGQLIVAVEGSLHRVDFANASLEPITPMANTWFDVTASGDRAVIVVPNDASSQTVDVALLDLGAGTRDVWTLPPGRVGAPAWDRGGTRLAFEVWFDEVPRVRIADVEKRTVVDSPDDQPVLRGPIWHPSGSFLIACRLEEFRGKLEFIEPEGFRRAETPIGTDHCPPFALSPDGRHVAVLVHRHIEVVKLSAMTESTAFSKIEGGERRTIGWLDDASAQALTELAQP